MLRPIGLGVSSSRPSTGVRACERAAIVSRFLLGGLRAEKRQPGCLNILPLVYT